MNRMMMMTDSFRQENSIDEEQSEYFENQDEEHYDQDFDTIWNKNLPIDT